MRIDGTRVRQMMDSRTTRAFLATFAVLMVAAYLGHRMIVKNYNARWGPVHMATIQQEYNDTGVDTFKTSSDHFGVNTYLYQALDTDGNQILLLFNKPQQSLHWVKYWVHGNTVSTTHADADDALGSPWLDVIVGLILAALITKLFEPPAHKEQAPEAARA